MSERAKGLGKDPNGFDVLCPFKSKTCYFQNLLGVPNSLIMATVGLLPFNT